MSGSIRGIITVLLMLLVTFPVVSLTPLAAERVFYPELRTPPGMDAAEALFTFEQILLDRGFRVTRHVYQDAQAALIMEIVENEKPRDEQHTRGPRYIFEFEVSPELMGEMILCYEAQSGVLVFEAARFEERYGGSGYASSFERVTDELLQGVIRDIEGRLK